MKRQFWNAKFTLKRKHFRLSLCITPFLCSTFRLPSISFSIRKEKKEIEQEGRQKEHKRRMKKGHVIQRSRTVATNNRYEQCVKMKNYFHDEINCLRQCLFKMRIQSRKRCGVSTWNRITQHQISLDIFGWIYFHVIITCWAFASTAFRCSCSSCPCN